MGILARQSVAVITDGSIKLAALLFDEIYTGYASNTVFDRSVRTEGLPASLGFADSDLDGEINCDAADDFYNNADPGEIKDPGAIRRHLDFLHPGDVVRGYSAKYKDKSFILFSKSDHIKEVSSGENVILRAVFESIPLPNIRVAPWDQILAFREDPSSVNEVRRLRMWLSDAIAATSVEQMSDALADRIDRYEWALEKHGFETLKGSIVSFLNPKKLVSVLGSAALASHFGSEWLAATAMAGYTLSEVGLQVKQYRIGMRDLTYSSSGEVAYLSRIRSEFGDESGK